MVEALHKLTGVGGPDAVLGIGMEAFLLSAAAVICLARALLEPRGRAPWLWIGGGLACWAVGTVLWDIVYSPDADPPYPSIADAFWLAWYPLTVFGLVLLVRERVRGFELHRWMDGVAVVLVVLTPAVAVIGTFLVLGCGLIALADGIFSVQQARGFLVDGGSGCQRRRAGPSSTRSAAASASSP